MLVRSTTIIGAIAGLALMLSPDAADAQVNFEGRGGLGVPAGDLSELTKLGGSIGAGVGYWVSPRVNLRLDGDVNISRGGDAAGLPDLRLWHYGGGAEVNLVNPVATRWSVLAGFGLGATTLATDAFAGGDVTETYFALNGGLKIGYDVTERVNLFVGGKAYLTFADEADLAPLAALAPELAGQDVERLWSFPVQAGLRVTLPGGPTRMSAR